MTLAQLLGRRVILVTGKGGVGKSAVAASLGLLGSRMGKRTLVVELAGQSVMSTYLGGERGHYSPTRRQPNLFSMSATPAESMEEYLTRELHSRSLYKLVFQNEYVAPFVGAVPALEDLVNVGKIMDLERSVGPSGAREWDLIVVDGPPTGQGLNLLRVSQAIMDMTRVGPMYKNTRIIHDLLVDPQRTAICLVTLPEEMPVNETIEMYRQIHFDLKMPLGPLFINEVRRRWFEESEARALRELSGQLDGESAPTRFADVLGTLLSATHALHRRVELEGEQIARLRKATPLQLVELPRLLTRFLGVESVEHLSTRLAASMEGA